MNKLKSVYVEITSKCNIKCPYCYNNSSGTGVFLKKDVIFSLIDQCFENNISEITISGGEPFLHPDIFNIIQYANEKHILVRIITNLSLISLETALSVLKSKNYFQLTIDSIDEFENDLTRGKGCFKKIMDLLQKAKDEGLSKRIVLRMNVGKNNIQRIDPFINLAIKYGIKHTSIAFIANCGRGSDYKYSLSYDESLNEMINVMTHLKQKAEDLKDIIDIAYNNLEEQRSCPIFNNNDIEINPRIDSSGNVFFCGYFFGNENIIGNVYKDNIANIINSKELKSFNMRVRKRKENQKCKQCVFNKVCCGGCPAISYINTLDILNVDTQCKMIKYFLKNKIKERK